MKKRLLSAALVLSLFISGIALPNKAEASTTKIYAVNMTRENTYVEKAPTASKASGTYIFFNGFDLTLSADSNAIIFYSLNNTGYRIYNSPIYINHNSTIKAYAFGKNGISSVANYTYELVPFFIASHQSGEYAEPQRVYLKNATNGAKVYYTLDGTIPNENSTPYADTGVVIPKSCTLKAVIVKAGWSRSYITRDFVIKNPLSEFDEKYVDGGLVIRDDTSSNQIVNKLNDYMSKWGYNQLNAAQKQAYEAMFNAAKSHTESVDIASLKIKKSDIDKLYWAFDYDNPQFYALANGYSYNYYPSTGYVNTISLKYSRTATQEENLKALFTNISTDVIETAKGYASDYDKLKYVHDWIINRTDYILNGPVYKSEADGPIIYGQALCEGYSKAFMYFAQSLGFDCICVVGTANGGPHMWNMVKINGSWYHVDTTFDDPIMSDGSRTLTYEHFLLGSYEIGNTHTVDTPFTVPYAPSSY